MAVRSS